MTDWAWEYVPDAENVVDGLEPDTIAQVERLGRRLADAASVKYFGEPRPEESGISPVLTHAEGRIILWYQEHRRFCLVFVLRVQYWPPS